MTKDKPRTWGGPRSPGPGKTMGRPTKYGEPMQQTTIRLPPAWRIELEAEFGSLQAGIETVVKQYLENKNFDIYAQTEHQSVW